MTRQMMLLAIGLFVAAPAAAQSGFNFGPDNGPQVARGSAWVARADSPLATFYNPGALTRQPRSLHVGGHFMSLDRCFARANGDGSLVSPGGGLPAAGSPNGPPAQTCTSGSMFLNSQFGAVIGLTRRVTLGLAVVGPHSVGKQEWPEVVSGPLGSQPASSRFLLVDEDSLLAFPTVSIGYAVTDTLSIGAGFVWGVYRETASAFAEGLSPAELPGRQPSDDFFAHQEVKLVADGHSNFIPGAVLGLLWSPQPTLDVGLWYRQSAGLDSDASLRLESRYWTPTGERNSRPCGSGEPADCNITVLAAKGSIAVPAEMRGGLRYHRPRDPSGRGSGDALADDVFDVEVDLAWANNSAVTGVNLDLSANAGQTVRGISTPTSIPGEVEEPKRWKDSLSLRIGGEYVVRPSRLAVQAGTFYENKGQDDGYLGTHFDLASKAGVSGGIVARLSQRFDAYLAYQHIFWADLNNGGAGLVPGFSMDPRSNNETRQYVNGGRVTSGMNEVAAGLTVRF